MNPSDLIIPLLLAGAVAALTVACGDGAGKKSAPMKIVLLREDEYG